MSDAAEDHAAIAHETHLAVGLGGHLRSRAELQQADGVEVTDGADDAGELGGEERAVKARAAAQAAGPALPEPPRSYRRRSAVPPWDTTRAAGAMS